jgi:hypothetical protein
MGRFPHLNSKNDVIFIVNRNRKTFLFRKTGRSFMKRSSSDRQRKIKIVIIWVLPKNRNQERLVSDKLQKGAKSVPGAKTKEKGEKN